MHTLASRARLVRRCVASVVLAGLSPAVLFASCSSQSGRPAELSADASVLDTYVAPEVGPDTYVAPDTYVVEASDQEAEPACVPTGDAGVTVSTTSLMFGTNGDGLVDCGNQATPMPITVSNNGCEPFTFTVTLTSGSSFYSVSPPSGSILPGQSQIVQVAPNTIPANPAQGVTPDGFQGTVAITTTAPGDASHIVQLHMTAHGAILTSNQLGTTQDFGSVQIGLSKNAPITVSNTGNADATLSFQLSNPIFTFDRSFPVTLSPITADAGADAGSQGVSFNVKFSPTAVTSYTDTLTTNVAAGPLCSPAPAVTQIKGAGANGVAVSPGSLDFLQVNCGEAGTPQSITITNTGPAITYTPSLKFGVNYTLTDGAGTTYTSGAPIALGAASSATLWVVPNKIPIPSTTATDAFADTLTITTTGAGDQPHIIALHETAQGAIFTLSPPNITASATPGQTVFPNFTVGNNGNLAASYTLEAKTTQGPPNTFTLTSSSGTVDKGQTSTGVLTCTAPPPSEAGSQQFLGTLTLSAAPGSILCAPVPSAMPLSLTD